MKKEKEMASETLQACSDGCSLSLARKDLNEETRENRMAK